MVNAYMEKLKAATLVSMAIEHLSKNKTTPPLDAVIALTRTKNPEVDAKNLETIYHLYARAVEGFQKRGPIGLAEVLRGVTVSELQLKIKASVERMQRNDKGFSTRYWGENKPEQTRPTTTRKEPTNNMAGKIDALIRKLGNPLAVFTRTEQTFALQLRKASQGMPDPSIGKNLAAFLATPEGRIKLGELTTAHTIYAERAARNSARYAQHTPKHKPPSTPISPKPQRRRRGH